MLMASKKSSKGVGLDGEESPGHVVSMQTEDLHLEKSTSRESNDAVYSRRQSFPR